MRRWRLGIRAQFWFRAVVPISQQGDTRMNEDEIQATIAQLQRQQAEQTAALRCALEGRWSDGADSLAGHIRALDPTINLNPKVPLYA